MTTAIEKWAAYPMNTVFVDAETYWRLRDVSTRFENKQIGEWQMASECMRIEPQCKLFHVNNLVVV